MTDPAPGAHPDPAEGLVPGESSVAMSAPSQFVEGEHTFATLTDKISALTLERTPRGWYIGFGISLACLLVFAVALGKLLLFGVGIWGNNQPVGWGWDIINFVWWIEIGHAGTLISAILLILKQPWRTSINRFAEAMTIFAVAAAGIYVGLHTGRPWLGYWLMPLPNTMGLWPQFRSAIAFDVLAIPTYATVSVLFWYMGLIPDLATLRDRAPTKLGKIAYGILAMGWRGSAMHWHRYETAYNLLAGIATALIVTVLTIISFDFALSGVPGWHSTIFPPYFLCGAVFSGFAMVVTLAVPLRKAYGLEDLVTTAHLDKMAKVMLATGLGVCYGYVMEIFMAWYSGDEYEWYAMVNRAMGPYAGSYWLLIFCNVVVPQALWSERVRTSPWTLFAISIVVNIGMWLERFVMIVVSLHRDFLPSAWGTFSPTIWDAGIFIGSFGLFFTLFFLFIRFLPVVSISEMRMMLPAATAKHDGGAH